MNEWQMIYDEDWPNRTGPPVRRFPVPCGWLYQVVVAWDDDGDIVRWSDPVFVPDASPRISFTPIGAGG